EAFIIRGQFDDYMRLLEEYDMEYVEVSDGSIEIPHDEKCAYIQRLAQNYRVLSEVGSKDAEKILREFDGGIQILKGRWGPYVQQVVKRQKIQVRLPKDREPESMTLADCQALLAPALAAKTAKKTSKKATDKTPPNGAATPNADKAASPPPTATPTAMQKPATRKKAD
ncbi:MAG: phosphosulfolactate synthase, partial [Thiothrix sp.]